MKSNREKRTPKGEPKLKIELNQEQRDAKSLYYDYDVNFLMGEAGSGKTLLAVAMALTSFRKREFDKIIITRPIVDNSMGFLPGDLEAKMKPWIYPIMHNFNMCQPPDFTEKMMKEHSIEILPIDYAKGITYVNSVVIIDEFQDLDYEDFRLMLTRLGKDSKIIFCGSFEQVHKSMTKKTCLHKVKKLKDSKGLVGFTELKENHRHSAMLDIIHFLES